MRMMRLREQKSDFEKEEEKRAARQSMRKLREHFGNEDKFDKNKSINSCKWPEGVKYCQTEIYDREKERWKSRNLKIRANHPLKKK